MKKPQTSIKTQWDLTPLLQNDSDATFEAEKKRVEEESHQFINKWKDREDYLTDERVLREALDEYEYWVKVSGVNGNLGHYYGLKKELDQVNAGLKARLQKANDLGNTISNAIQFFTLKLGKVDKESQAKFLASPLLSPYKHYLEKLFLQGKYLLSDPEEKIINLKWATSHSNWVDMVSGFIADEEEVALTEEGKKEKLPFSKLLKLVNSPDKAVRDSAGKAVNTILKRQVKVTEAEYNAIINNWKIEDELRGRDRPDLARHLSDDLESSVVDVLVAAVTKNNAIAHRYFGIKAKILGQDKLKYYERGATYGSVKVKYPYEQSLELVRRVFEGLDPQFAKILMTAHENGCVDVFPKKGKESGAFCSHDLIGSPTYVLLNHSERLRDVTTLAHEFGHAINYELIKEKQNALNFALSLATAEVASTFMEDFVLRELMKEADDEMRLSLLLSTLDEEIASTFRQVACYRFEQAAHKSVREKGYLSHKEIGALFKKYMAEYLGDFVELSEGSENWWVYWSHIRNFFYVYSYASGSLISKALQTSVKTDPTFISKVKEFLAAGISDSPKNIFARMGVDITDEAFWDKGLGEIDQAVSEIEALAKKLGKISSN